MVNSWGGGVNYDHATGTTLAALGDPEHAVYNASGEEWSLSGEYADWVMEELARLTMEGQF